MNVFIAESSPFIRDRLCSLLSEIPGIAIIGQAGDGDEAISLIRAHVPDVVILDSSLPPKGGLSLLSKLRSNGSTPVVIVIASFPTLQYRTKFHEAGAAFFFDKSREQDRIVQAIATIKEELAC
jgi:DNA-binding NarL/FixJ family response regulator